MTESPQRITLFADFTCPFCLVTELGLERIARSRPIALQAKSFELYPAPAPLPDPPHADADLEAVGPLAREVGVTLRPPRIRPRTRKAHEAAHFAAERGVGARMRAAIYRAYWGEGADIGRIDVLTGLAEEIGVDATELKIALDIDRGRDTVLADARLALRLGVAQVPTLFLGSGPTARILQGARSLAALDEAMVGG